MSMRNIHIGDKVYQYKIGKQREGSGSVLIRLDNKRIVVDSRYITKFKGHSCDEDIPIKPSQVKEFIENNLDNGKIDMDNQTLHFWMNEDLRLV